jgi:hypothetical protein
MEFNEVTLASITAKLWARRGYPVALSPAETALLAEWLPFLARDAYGWHHAAELLNPEIARLWQHEFAVQRRRLQIRLIKSRAGL